MLYTFFSLVAIVLIGRQIILTILSIWMYWTGDAPFEATAALILKSAADELNFKQSDHLVDLGSGTGSASFVLARYAHVRVTGIEQNRLLYLWSRVRHLFSRVKSLVHLLHTDVFSYDLTTFSHVYLYMSPAANRRFLNECLSQLQQGSYILAYRWPLESSRLQLYKQIEHVRFGFPLYIYRKR